MLRCILQRCAGALDPISSRGLVLLHRFHLTPANLSKGALSGYLGLRIRQAAYWQEREAAMAEGFVRSTAPSLDSVRVLSILDWPLLAQSGRSL
jgi:hypothetical protein